MMSSMKRIRFTVLVLSVMLLLLSGCAGERKNITYNPGWADVKKIERPVTGAVIPIADLREQTKVYPKQVIVRTDYDGDVSYDINDRTPAEVLDSALAAELSKMGVELVPVSGIEGPLDKESADRIRKTLAAEYPEVRAAFGGKLKDFIATSKKTLIAYDVHVTAWFQFYVLDVETGDLAWSDFKTEWDDVDTNADHNYMVDQLSQAVVNLMQKSVRDNASMRDLLIKAGR